jgi:hypothetical protein
MRWVEHGTAPTEISITKYVNDDPAQGAQMVQSLRALNTPGTPEHPCG